MKVILITLTNLKSFSLRKTIAACLIWAVFFSFLTALSFAGNEEDEDKWTGTDKAKHVAVSCGISIFAYNYYKKNTDFSDSKAKTTAFLTALAIGAVKEFIDDEFSWKDMGANALGAGVGVVMSIEF